MSDTVEPKKHKGGRPRFLVDETKLRVLAKKLWSTRELAAFFGCSHDLMCKRYYHIIKEERENGKAYIRDLQWKAAEGGDTKVLLHLSKHHLGEHDQQKLTVERMSSEDLARIVEARLLADTNEPKSILSGEQDSQDANDDE